MEQVEVQVAQQQDLVKDPHYYVELVKAIYNGDWEAAKAFFDLDPWSLTAKITEMHDTPLHVAISSSRSPEFIRRLVDLLPHASLGTAKLFTGFTALHFAAMVGNVEAAQILVHKSPELLQQRASSASSFDLPVTTAARYSQRDAVTYLLSVTPDHTWRPLTDDALPPINDGVVLLNLLIFDDFYGLALHLLRRFPSLARGRENFTHGSAAIFTLAEKPQAFPSGTRVGHCRRFWSHCKSSLLKVCKTTFATTTEIGKEHTQVMELLRLLISEILKAASTAEVKTLLAPAISLAAMSGISEIVKEIVKAYPMAMWFVDTQGRDIFHVAVMYRQEKVFNIMYQMSAAKTLAAAFVNPTTGDNLLHMAGKLGPTDKIPGAALQLQRELQWFNQEVEKIVQPTFREMDNNELDTPSDIFTEQHETLIEQGEKWMKDTANSCSLVAALVVTVAFAAAFTLPGGSKDDGTPNYLNKPSLMVFLAADTLALFSSSTSLLMFLGILTSRYSEKDFLRSLPMKMGIGLLTLFLSIAAMLIAFGASLHLVLYHNVNWIMVPIGLVASVPSLLFAFLQFPLLVELLFSTFGPSIFGKQSDEIIM
ncbi:unnamed protein product [Linum tenue]|uniref:PGG domain-containing protein n=5 Tax=Linum tenue TaxID=586396 RepID=A0AAV0NB04_9ROSI|nr:unnamed protein product [Linum tenue]